MPARYIVGLDGTGSAQAALSWATDHASAEGCSLMTVRLDELSQNEHQERSATVRTHPRLTSETIVLHGTIPQALAEFAHDDDLLVIGTGKTGFIHARVFGALGIQIVSAVRCSVAIVPDLDLRFRSSVVAGVHRQETAAMIALAAGIEAAAREEPLQFVMSSIDGVAAPELRASTLDTAAATAKAQWPDLTVRTRMTTRPAAEALLDASRNAALLVLGPGTGRTPPYFSEVIHDVLLNINAPVLIVRR